MAVGGQPPPTELVGQDALLSRNHQWEDAEREDRSLLPLEEVAHSSRVAGCSTPEVVVVGAGTPKAEVGDDVGTCKDQVGLQGVVALHHSKRAVAGKCQEADTGPCNGLLRGASNDDPE